MDGIVVAVAMILRQAHVVHAPVHRALAMEAAASRATEIAISPVGLRRAVRATITMECGGLRLVDRT